MNWLEHMKKVKERWRTTKKAIKVICLKDAKQLLKKIFCSEIFSTSFVWFLSALPLFYFTYSTISSMTLFILYFFGLCQLLKSFVFFNCIYIYYFTYILELVPTSEKSKLYGKLATLSCLITHSGNVFVHARMYSCWNNYYRHPSSFEWVSCRATCQLGK